MVHIQPIKNRGFLFSYDYFTEYSLNIYLIKGQDHYYIIDTGMGTGSILPVLDLIGHDPKEIIVINTHYHWDHIWGNHVFKDSMIISHRLCRELIDTHWEGALERNRRYVDGIASKCLPNLVFDSELYFPQDQLRLFYAPGHTIDGISILDEKEKVLIVGDNIGDTLEEPLPELDCDKKLYTDIVTMYQSLDFDTCISGHNQVLGKEFMGEILSRLK